MWKVAGCCPAADLFSQGEAETAAAAAQSARVKAMLQKVRSTTLQKMQNISHFSPQVAGLDCPAL
jgi:hypothetical protein